MHWLLHFYFGVSYSCRPTGYPYWFGLLLPSGISIAVTFLLLFVAPCLQHHVHLKDKDDNSTWRREYIGLVFTLILFCITWGFGIPATNRLNIGIGRVIFQAIFITGSFLLGITVLLFFCLFSQEVRKKWAALLSQVCVLPGHRGQFSLTKSDRGNSAEDNINMVRYAPNTTGLETKGATKMSEKVPSGKELVIANPLNNNTMGNETKVDLERHYEEIDSKDTKL